MKKSLAKFLSVSEEELDVMTEDQVSRAISAKANDSHQTGMGKAYLAVRNSLKSVGITTEEGSTPAEIADAVKANIPTDDIKITDDQIVSSKKYKDLETSYNTTKNELDTLKVEVDKKSKLDSLKSESQDVLKDFIVPAKKSVADLALSSYYDKIGSIVEKKGKFFDADGNEFIDGNKLPLTKAQIYAQIANDYFDEKVESKNDEEDDEIKSPSESEDKKQQQKSTLKPKNDEEINAILASSSYTDEQKDSALSFFKSVKK